MRRSSIPHVPDKQLRPGFTLVELLIVIGLLLLLAGMTVSAINLTVDGDKVRNGSRQVQSYLEGARDRAIFSKEPRGVRFLLDPTNNRTVSSMVFIGPTDNWSDGTIQLERLDTDNDGTADSAGSLAFVVRGFDNNTSFPSPTGWVDLYRRRLLTNGARIRIPRAGGTWYTVQTNLLPYADPQDPLYGGTNYPPRLQLTVAYRESPTNLSNSAVPAFNPGSGPQTYELELPPTVLPNQEPVLMPKGVVIDLDRCNKTSPANTSLSTLPEAWMSGSGTTFTYSSQMDVLFSPRGVVIGSSAQKGLIHFFVTTQKSADNNSTWTNMTNGDRVLVTVFTRTGAISSHHIYPGEDTNLNGVLDGTAEDLDGDLSLDLDPFRFAETGEVAGK